MLTHYSSFTKRGGLFAGLLFTIIVFSSCAGKVLFQSNFDTNTIGQPPLHTQQVGNINIDGPAGSVAIIASPIASGGKWVRITRQNNPQSITNMQCNSVSFEGNGEYLFSSVMHIPAGSGVASIQFERFGQSANDVTGGFLHIDFTEDNRVRIDDKAETKFGSFSRGRAFMVQVTLKINATGSSTAHIALGGDGAEGAADYTIQSPLLTLAHQFGAVRLWMGFPHVGSFDASTIVLKKLNK